ncbi:hypothetical protein SKAU_G00402900 [Synaphobranchus kaupii]|uniref:Uncharacterized protein n=1 Tax=Synaphobranchus kaupii TaxID=118154 RepID=A0A9Q1ICJ5_SYNKA|nr:hypothetical protein SKAU_G00402900 [Synaphobranchus kaupii]
MGTGEGAARRYAGKDTVAPSVGTGVGPRRRAVTSTVKAGTESKCKGPDVCSLRGGKVPSTTTGVMSFVSGSTAPVTSCTTLY